MTKEFYKDLISEFPGAYSYHKMIYDDNGVPIDYEFIEVNQYFEHISSLKASDIVGKRICELVPEFKNDKYDWIGTYGDVALNNKRVNFDAYSEFFGKWYRIFSYSPQKDYFVVMAMDITDLSEKAQEESALYTVMNDIIIELDENFRFIKFFASEKMNLLFSKKIILGKNVEDIFSGKIVENFYAAANTAKAEGKKQTIEFKYVTDKLKWYIIDIKYVNFQNRGRYIVNVGDITEQKELEQKSNENQSLFKTIFEQAPIGIAFVKNKIIMGNINPEFEKIMGRSKEELINIDWTSLTHSDDLKENLELYDKFNRGEISGYSLVKRFIRPDGTFVWVYMVISHMEIDSDSKYDSQHICMIQDISQTISSSEALRESERSKASLLARLPGMEFRCLNDKYWTMNFISDGCFELTGYKKESLLYNSEISYNDVISPEYKKKVMDDWAIALEKHAVYKGEYEITTANESKKWVLEKGQGIYDTNGKVIVLEGLIVDVTERKNQDEKIKYLNNHDPLTGLYNRQFCETEMKRLDEANVILTSVIVGDINGLRLVNNAFGYEDGDHLIIQAASCMKKFCRDTDIVARTGGDDFSIILPNTDSETALGIMEKIKADCRLLNKVGSDDNSFNDISLGCSTRTSADETLFQTYLVAEDYMNKRKLLDRKSSHRTILTSIMSTVFAKSEETEQHSERLAKLSKTIGEKIGLAQKNLDLLELFAILHDVGKIGIDDSVLKKPGKLNNEEWDKMKKHPEIGYKIAASSPELEPIAEYILTHHEHWDGSGYPQGLAGEKIPLLSRILAVADAYDAMTENRVYRAAINKAEAIKEIIRCSGTQFDPKIVDAFQSIVESNGLLLV